MHPNELINEKNEFISRVFEELENERRATKIRAGEDIWKMSKALSDIKDMSIEGKLIREDLLGLLEFESLNKNNIDSLMIERRKNELADHRLFSNDIKSKKIQ